MEELHESENPPPPQFVYVESTARLAGINDGQWLIMMLYSMLNMDDEYHEHDPIYIHLFILIMNHLYHLYIHLCLWMMNMIPFIFRIVHPILAPPFHDSTIAEKPRAVADSSQPADSFPVPARMPRPSAARNAWPAPNLGRTGKNGEASSMFGWVNDEDPLLWLIYPIIRPWLHYGYTVLLCYTNVWEKLWYFEIFYQFLHWENGSSFIQHTFCHGESCMPFVKETF